MPNAIKTTVSEFCRSVTEWHYKSGLCPRCGEVASTALVSYISGVPLCACCFCDEDVPQFENYDNWAVNLAVRAVCDTDIKII